MKSKKLIIGAVALGLSSIMFTQAVPMELLQAAAEGLEEILTSEEIEAEQIGTINLSDKDNLENLEIIAEDIDKRTLRSKEFIMTNGMRMIEQYIEPIHYYEDGEYKEIEKPSLEETVVEKEAAKINVADATATVTQEKHFKYASVAESGETEISGKELYVGKKDEETKSDAFIQFKMPKTESYYTLLGAKVNFTYETKGASLFNRKNLNYNVYVADSEAELSEITYESKPTKLQELTGIAISTRKEETSGYTSEFININHIKNDSLTIGIETTSETTEDGYISLATTESSMSVTSFYKINVGIEDSYSMESFEIGGATAYVNNATGLLTMACDLASVNTFTGLPFEGSLIYNSDYNSIFNASFSNIRLFGNNFKLNFQQYIKATKDPETNESVYEWYDADGSITTFTAVASSSNEYYNASKDLTYNTTTGLLTDGGSARMYFSSGKLSKIEDANNANERIEINYEPDTSYNISEIEYYQDNTLTYTMNFCYTGGQVTTVTTKKGEGQLLTYTLAYSEGDLISITDTTNAQQPITLLNFKYDSQTEELEGIFNYNKDGIYIERGSKDNFKTSYVQKVFYVKGHHTTTGKLGYFEPAALFSYSGAANTKISYYEAGKVIGYKDVAFNNVGGNISEWYTTIDGEISVSTKGNWNERSEEQQLSSWQYIQTNIQFTLEENTSIQNAVCLNEGDSRQVEITSVQGIPQNVLDNDPDNDLYKYSFNFKVSSTNEICLYILRPDDEDYEALTVQLSNGGTAYVSIPCNYYGVDSAFTIYSDKNNTTISNVSYTVSDYTETISERTATCTRFKLTKADTYSTTGTRTTTTYDEKQRASTVKTQTSQKIETATYAYTSDDKISSVVTKDEANTELSRTNYSYQKENDGKKETTTVTTTKGGLKTQSSSVTDRSELPYTVTQTDESGVRTVGYYQFQSGDLRLTKITYGKSKELYTYNTLGQVTSVIVSDTTSNGTIYTQINNYVNGRYTGTTDDGGTYWYGYDEYGITTSINYNEQEMLSYTYKQQTNKSDVNTLTRKTYANGQVEEYAYQSNKYTVTYKNSASATASSDVYEYNFDKVGNITSQSHKDGRSSKICYAYDTMDEYNPELKITGINIGYTLTYTVHYDKKKHRATSFELYSFVSCESTESVTGSYAYDDEGRLISSSYGGAWCEEYTYDALGRTVGILNGNYPNEQQDFTFGYQRINGYETNRLVRITDNTYQGSDSTATYDTNGYITGMTYGDQTHTYEYDAFGRLTKETINGTPTTYTYDSANNITSKTVNGTSKNYTYDDNNLLDTYGTYSFTYDKMGNPTKYKGNTFVWKQGRKLASGSMNGKSFTYTYDPNGMRYKKVVNGVTTNYYYNGTQLLMEDRGSGMDRIYYIYGANGISGMIVQEGYTQYTYYFDKNVLGDIIAIRNQQGDIIARYTYDAWGNHKVLKASGTTDNNQSSIGNINPFRYRGYYYDTETGFYYLQTRYYDPTICRFINADDYELVADLASSLQLNMYAYCGNNPIMYTDETGELVLSTILIGALIGFGVSFASSVIMQAAFNYKEKDIWEIMGAALIDGLFGAAAGAVGALGISSWIVGGINAGLSFANGVLTTGIEQNWQFSTTDWILISGNAILSGVVSGILHNGQLDDLIETNSFTSKIRGRISSGYYGTGGGATKSIASATAQANKMVFNYTFSKGFYFEYLIMLAQAGFSQAMSTATFYLV